MYVDMVNQYHQPHSSSFKPWTHIFNVHTEHTSHLLLFIEEQRMWKLLYIECLPHLHIAESFSVATLMSAYKNTDI